LRAYFGSVPLTPEDRHFAFDASGVRDPLRGNAYAPAWPAVPVAGSPIAQVLDRFESLRTQVSLDDEPKTRENEHMQSLRVHLELTLQ
jgi:hypothetical protein